MPRMPRVVIPAVPHHVTQRGNRREAVFFADLDRQKYVQLLLEHSASGGLTTLAYCLMTNHVHLVCVPRQAASLAGALGPVNLRYAQHVNRTQRLTGRLWQGRFFSCALDDPHLWAAIRYVERNPVRAGLVARAEDYPWSSAAAHCGLRRDPLLAPLPDGVGPPTGQWSDWLTDPDDPKALATLRLNTGTGRPAGDKGFVAKLEAMVGRTLWPKPVGRPKKEKDDHEQ